MMNAAINLVIAILNVGVGGLSFAAYAGLTVFIVCVSAKKILVRWNFGSFSFLLRSKLKHLSDMIMAIGSLMLGVATAQHFHIMIFSVFSGADFPLTVQAAAFAAVVLTWVLFGFCYFNYRLDD